MSRGWDEPRCVWCHKTGGTIEPLYIRVPNVTIFSDKERDIDVSVHTEHKDETCRYYARVHNNARRFLSAVFLGVVGLIIFAVLGWIAGEAFVIIYYGIVFIVFPFATGTTLEIAGIKNSIRFVQVTGAAFIIGGSIALYAIL